MRYVVILAAIPFFTIVSCEAATVIVQRLPRSPAFTNNAVAAVQPVTKEERRERRKERRMLRKKKQRMKELREEIRLLTLSLHDKPNSNVTAVFNKAEVRLKQKDRHGRKGVKWRRNLLEKLKGIMRRLDRMERRLTEGKIVSASTAASLRVRSTKSTPPLTVAHEIVSQKLKRIQPAISRSRSGENGTTCSSHKDCRPGHCCHRLLSEEGSKSICILHRLPERAECVDGCQCSTQLNCFIADIETHSNATNAYCKKAASSDILHGSYLYNKDSVIVVNGSSSRVEN